MAVTIVTGKARFRGDNDNMKMIKGSRVVYAKPRVKQGKGLTQIIKKVIASQVETKYIARDVLFNTSFNSPVVSTSELYSCIPAMAQGTTSSTRDGQKVSPKTCRIRGTIALASDDKTADIVAYMYVFTSKKFKNYDSLIASFNVNEMLDDGQSGTTSPTGQALVALYPVEKEQITLLSKKQFHLQKGFGFQNSGGSSDNGVGGGSSTLRNFDIKIKCPAHLMYSDQTTPSHATNFAPVVCFGYYHTDGTSPDILNQAIVVNMRSELYYDDA